MEGGSKRCEEQNLIYFFCLRPSYPPSLPFLQVYGQATQGSEHWREEWAGDCAGLGDCLIYYFRFLWAGDVVWG